MSRGTGHEYRVLLIEDNPGDAFLIKFYLEESPVDVFHFHHAENLQSGIDLYRSQPFDIVLMDMHLPDAGGMETIQKFFAAVPDALVIVLTGLTDERIGLETLKLGAQDFLTKGKFEGNVLIKSIRYAHERFQLNSKLQSFRNRLQQLSNHFLQLQESQSVASVEFRAEDTVQLSEAAQALLNTKGKAKQKREELMNLLPEDCRQLLLQNLTQHSAAEWDCQLNGKACRCLLSPLTDGKETDGAYMNLVFLPKA